MSAGAQSRREGRKKQGARARSGRAPLASGETLQSGVAGSAESGPARRHVGRGFVATGPAVAHAHDAIMWSCSPKKITFLVIVVIGGGDVGSRVLPE